MALTVYHTPHTRSVRVLWICEELEIPYTIKRVAPIIHGKLPQGYEHIHPLGGVPAIVDDDVTMFDSLAILQYLSARHGGRLSVPSDSPEYAAFLQWFQFSESHLAPHVETAIAHLSVLPPEERDQKALDRARSEIMRIFDVLTEAVRKNVFIMPSGDFTIADISLAYMINLTKYAKVFDDAPLPLRVYANRCANRRGYTKSMLK